ncbi:glycosyltransferase family 2 protein [Anabaena sp. UHCC 0399]|uniref:glycosyltransferase family 2 protein n=1 Tax=Anabaena sp. UHCC 0399 TaxID=3110238 RepID=UPI002B1F395A|nr:glycosyltransferase family 2 protein [Anabaena sp. UHCC 0399]MEA5564396.1 glycosyltransferase family 2 protein [Anabaena sp. UHCC 0399]
MKFSIVISTYNRLHLLRRAIDSALKQTIPCEVVVADDCSSEDTEKYVRSLGSSVVYHRNQVNQGHAATVNAGVEKASGDWIKFLDDDDYLDVNCIEQMAKAIALCPDAVICSCIAAQVDTNAMELSRTPLFGPGLAFYIPQVDIHYGMLLELVPFGTPVQVACRRDAFLKTGGWDSQLNTNCDDIDSWIRIAKFGHGIFLNQCLAYRTIWPGAYNQKFSFIQRLNTNVLMKEKIYSLVNKKHHDYLPDIEEIKQYLKLHWTVVALKKKDLQGFLGLLNISLCSFANWKFLLTVLYSRRLKMHSSHVKKFVLIDDFQKCSKYKIH